MDNTIDSIVQSKLAGLISLNEAQSLLDSKGVRGGFEDTRYMGFDYTNQVWIDISYTT